MDYLKSMVHTTAVNITKMFGITGRVISSSTACTTSSQSIGFGYETVKFGLQDAMLCGRLAISRWTDEGIRTSLCRLAMETLAADADDHYDIERAQSRRHDQLPAGQRMVLDPYT